MFMKQSQVERIKQQYPPGTRIQLNHMDDPYAPVPPGTEGVVSMVDDAGQLHMKWDNGRSLALTPGHDSFMVKNFTAKKIQRSVCVISFGTCNWAKNYGKI